jgi:hypothetical protein
MPGVVETKRDEHKWQKAKGIAEEAGHKDNYAYIMGIYKQMKPDYEFKTEKAARRVASAWINRVAGPSLRDARSMGPYIKSQYGSNPEPTTAKKAVAAFLAKLTGYPGLVGEADRNAERMTAAKGIANALRNQGMSEIEISSGATHLSASFRTHKRWEEESDWDQEEGTEKAGDEYETRYTKILRPWADKIKKTMGNTLVRASYGEKGWWSVEVNLK